MALPFRRQIRQGYPGAGSRMLNYGALASAWLSFDSHFHYRPEKEIEWISRSGSIQLVLFASLLRRTADSRGKAFCRLALQALDGRTDRGGLEAMVRRRMAGRRRSIPKNHLPI